MAHNHHHHPPDRRTRATPAPTYPWPNTQDWEPSACPRCGNNRLGRVSIRTAQGDGADAWVCERCDSLVVREGVYVGDR